jgi:riboflavin synthase
MFTGIIQEMGRVVRFERRGGGAHMTVQASRVSDGLGENESISVDGTCLTVVTIAPGRFSMEISGETIRKSTLGTCRPGRRVNLERAVTPTGLFGGHLVQGHVDGTAEVVTLDRNGEHAILKVSVPSDLIPYIVPKGSIALNGVSLTVADRHEERVTIALIPTTLKETNLGGCRRGDRLNLEVDIIGKYIRSFMDAYAK